MEYHICGGNKGETILIKLSCGSWAVVDCYLSKKNKIDDELWFQILKENKVESLKFACLTHPHADHINGFESLINNFNIKRLLCPSFYEPATVHSAIEKIYAVASGSDGIRKDLETTNSYRRLCEHAIDNKIPIDLLSSNRAPFYPELGNDSAEKIVCLHPTGQAREYFIRDLVGLIQNFISTESISKNARIPYNRISLALFSYFNEALSVLGGDVEPLGWDEILKVHPEINISKAILVKVSHHGSMNGMTIDAWKTIGDAAQTISVIAPYKKYGLPELGALNYIFANSKRVFVASRKALDDLNTNLVSPIEDVCGDAFSQSVKKGCVSVILENNTIKDVRLLGDACEIFQHNYKFE